MHIDSLIQWQWGRGEGERNNWSPSYWNWRRAIRLFIASLAAALWSGVLRAAHGCNSMFRTESMRPTASCRSPKSSANCFG